MSDRCGTVLRPRGIAASILLVTTGLGLLIGLLVSTAAAPVASAATAATTTAMPKHVVLIGVAGLTWDDVTATTTPTLYRLAGTASDGALLVRGVRQRACAGDGWLTLGTGVRTLVPRPLDGRGVEVCAPLRQPARTASGYRADVDLGAVTAANADFYSPHLGNVGDSLAAQSQCSTAVGSGAAVMLMTSSGTVERYVPDVSAVSRRLLASCPLTAIDLGQIPPAPSQPGQQQLLPADESGAVRLGTTRQQGLALLDAQVARILQQTPPGATVVLTSTADETWEPRIRVLMVQGPGPGTTTYDHGILWSPGTRQPGLVQLTDVTALVLATLDVPPVSAIVGSVPESRPTQLGVADVITTLAKQDLRAQAIRITSYTVTQGLAYVLAGLILLAAVQLVWSRRHPLPERRTQRIDRLWQIAVIYVASLPVATFLANLLPWDRTESAARAASAVISFSLVIGLVLTLIALLGPWRRRAFGPVLVIAAVTLVVLVADVTTGSRLQLDSLFGLAPLVGGRFYGFGNVAFSLFGVAALFTAVGMVGQLLKADRARAAGAVVGVFGLACALVDGWPRFGADFGGMIALVAAFATMATLVMEVRLTVRRVAGIAALALLVPAVVAFLDWLRPPASRTHLGQFVQSVFDGTAGGIMSRKALASLASFGDFLLAPLIPVVLFGLAVLVLAPERVHAPRMRAAYREIPALRAGLVGCIVLAVVGWLVNDSGLIVAEVVMVLALPLGTAAVVAVPRRAPEPPEPMTRSAQSRRASSP